MFRRWWRTGVGLCWSGFGHGFGGRFWVYLAYLPQNPNILWIIALTLKVSDWLLAQQNRKPLLKTDSETAPGDSHMTSAGPMYIGVVGRIFISFHFLLRCVL